MSKTGSDGEEAEHSYRRSLHDLQVELVKFQRHLIDRGERIAVVIEGRDAAGKDGVIKHIAEHLSPRETRIVALPAPTGRQQTMWYYQRYVAHLPAAAEFVLFNRSWYNRAGVERVMGFCSEAETEIFLADAPIFERMLVNSGIQLFKYYLDIDREEQARRLKERRHDPLDPVEDQPHRQGGAEALGRLHAGSRRDAAPHPFAPCALAYRPGGRQASGAPEPDPPPLGAPASTGRRSADLLVFDPAIVFAFDESRLDDGSLAG